MANILGSLTTMALSMLLMGFVAALDMHLAYYIPAILCGLLIGAAVTKIFTNKT